jgi:phosphotriesterase-related protein
MIRTVLGDIEPKQLGVTLCHEHIVLNGSADQVLTPDDVISELEWYKQMGGGAVVELTNTGLGRDVLKLRDVASATGLNIVCGTGFYKQSHYPAYVHEASIDSLAECMIRDIKQGIQDSEIRAGAIGEIGTSQDQITPDEEKVLRASARAAISTGAPLSTHTSFGYQGLEQVAILRQEGVRLEYVSIGHLDLLPDPDYHESLARQGVFIQYDTFGKHMYQDEGARVACVARMVERGFVDHILLSCDITRRPYLKKNGGWGYVHLLESVVPALRAHGVRERDVQKMLIDNPARFLDFED